MSGQPFCLVSNLFTEIVIPEKGILSHTVYDDDTVKVILFGFAAGEELTAHTAPVPAEILVLEGEAAVTLGEEHVEVAAGALTHMNPHLTHGIVARTRLRMLLTLLKSARSAAN